MRYALITGGVGFIASYLSRQLIDGGSIFSGDAGGTSTIPSEIVVLFAVAGDSGVGGICVGGVSG